MIAGGIFAAYRRIANRPVDYVDIREHFKYGSIGSAPVNGIPYWIWKVLPEMFPEKLPGKGYASLGFLVEPGKETPIGFSQRTVFVNRAGLNCAVCHTGTYRESANSQPNIVLGMPANKLDLQGYINFLTDCALDPRFSPAYMIPAIEAIGGPLIRIWPPNFPAPGDIHRSDYLGRRQGDAGRFHQEDHRFRTSRHQLRGLP